MIPIDQSILQSRTQAIHIAQQILPIIIQAEMALAAHETLHKDDYLDDEHAGKRPNPAEIVQYSLDIGTEFIKQAELLLNSVPGLTGTT